MVRVEPWNGRPISRAGAYSNVPISIYHSGKLCVGPSISSSGLRTIFSQSEAHYWDQSPFNPNRAERVESEAFIMGRATHHLLLGEPFFAKTFVVKPTEAPDGSGPWNGNKKVCRKWLEDQAKAERTVLTPDMVQRIKWMALALGKEHLVRAGALNGLIECTMAWPDPETGVWLLSRPDVIPTDSGDFVDLKTTTDVSFASLTRTVGEYGYHQQGALVEEGYKTIFKRDITSFSLYFIESRRPHCARMVTLKSEDLKLGAKQNRNALRRFVACMNSGVWPGPGGNQETVQYIEISDRQRELIETRLKMEGTDG